MVKIIPGVGVVIVDVPDEVVGGPLVVTDGVVPGWVPA